MHYPERKFAFCKAFICICILILFPSIVHGDENNGEILVIGSGPITQGNLAEARKLAISDAHLKGIEAYLEKTLGSQGMVNNFQDIIKGIIPGSADVIENFRELATDDTGKSYKMLVSLKVNEKLMEERLRNAGIIIYEGVPIRLLFLVSDKLKPDEPAYIWWDDPESKASLSASELLLYQLFQERGFNPVNRLTSMPDKGYNPELFKQNLTDEEVAQWGRLYSADVVITGKIAKNEFNTYTADIKAIDAGSGAVIAGYTYKPDTVTDPEAAGTGMNTPDKIISAAVTAIIPDILKVFKKEGEKKSSFDVALKGMDNLKQVTAFMSFIKAKISGVVSVLPARITPGTMTVSVEYSGDRNTFIQKMRNSTEVPFAVHIEIDKTGLLTVTSM